MFRTTHIEAEAILPPSPDPQPVPRLHITNHGLPPALQLDAWRDMVKSVVEITPDARNTEGFAVDIKAWDLGRIALVRSTSPAAGFQRSALHIRNSSIDHWCFAAVKNGRFETSGGGHATVAEPGTLFVKSLQSPVEGVMSQTTSLCVFVPRDFCRERVSAIDAADDSVLNSGLGRLLADYVINLDRQLRWLSSDEVPGVLAATRAMIDACVAPSLDRLAAAVTPINATLLERAKEMVQKNLLSPSLGVDELCRGLGISRSRLYRLFEDHGGVVHYIRSRRLLDAHRILASGEDCRAIVDIAAERDFLDPADFSRAFKREFGYSPKEARLSVKPPKHGPVAPPAAGGSLTDLLARLH